MNENSPGNIPLTRKGFISNYPHFRYWKKKAATEMMAPEPVNIYLHVPFCAQRCAYCYYKTEQLQNRKQLEDYTNALCHEINLANQQFQLAKRPVKSVYIGGGTPSLLTGDMLKHILETLKENFDFNTPELTLEAEPRTLTSKKVALYHDLGVNRISIGVQSFNNDIIKLSGRNHTADKARQAIQTVRETGDITINIDLLSGLAGETPDTWKQSLETALDTGVHSITVYKMEAYLNTEFFNKGVRKNEIQLPNEQEELNFMKTAINTFTNANYYPWSFFTYTREGKYPHQYAINTWKGEDCCAFGPSGFGVLGQYNYQNGNELNTYLEKIHQNQLPIIRAHRMTARDSMVKDILLGMKLSAFDRTAFTQRHGIDLLTLIPNTLQHLQNQEYIHLDDETIRLTTTGLLYGDYVGKCLATALKDHTGEDQFRIV